MWVIQRLLTQQKMTEGDPTKLGGYRLLPFISIRLIPIDSDYLFNERVSAISAIIRLLAKP